MPNLKNKNLINKLQKIIDILFIKNAISYLNIIFN